MSEQNLTKNPEQPVKVEPTATAPVITGGKTFTEQELEQIIKERLDREKVASEKKSQAAAEKAAAEAAAKNGEWEKVAKAHELKLAEMEKTIKAKELADLKRTIAEKVGLPKELAARLMGDTPEEIEKDAQALLATLPKPQKPAAGPVANPGMGAQAAPVESDIQRLQRIHGTTSNAWSVDTFRKQGGGVIVREE